MAKKNKSKTILTPFQAQNIYEKVEKIFSFTLEYESDTWSLQYNYDGVIPGIKELHEKMEELCELSGDIASYLQNAAMRGMRNRMRIDSPVKIEL